MVEVSNRNWPALPADIRYAEAESCNLFLISTLPYAWYVSTKQPAD